MNPSELDDFEAAIIKNGFLVDDFELHEVDTTDYSLGVVYKTGTVTVKRKSTVKEITYSRDPGTHWTVDFEMDLKRGKFN